MKMLALPQDAISSIVHQIAGSIIDQLRKTRTIGDYFPTLFIVHADQGGQLEIVSMTRESLGEDLPARQMTLFSAGTALGMAKDHQVVMVLLGYMGWGVFSPTPEEAQRMPSESLRREEIVTLASLTVDRKQSLSIIRLDRDPDGVLLPLYVEYLSETIKGANLEDNLLPFFFEGYFGQGAEIQ
jgi:hypothetical protein